jgi:hypothetical protein
LIAVQSSGIRVDTLVASKAYLKKFRVQLNYNRNLNRIIISESSQINFSSFQVNGKTADPYGQDSDAYHVYKNRFKNNLIDYYVVNQEPLYFEFEVEKDQDVEFVINEISFDLLSHPMFSIKKRPKDKIPKPFIVNDAIITKQKLKL